MKNKTFSIKNLAINLFASLVLTSGCSKFIDVGAPVNNVTAENVYNEDLTAAAALTGIYTQMSNNNFNSTSVNIWTGLSADELGLWNLNNINYVNYYQNNLSANTTNNVVIWTNTYPFIYRCNEAIEGISSSSTLSNGVKWQLLGEAKFLRAFFYFQLVNIFGEVPLALSPDYKVNAILPRLPVIQVYKQMITDLLDAKSLLSSDYLTSYATGITTERVRPNKFCAMALLARVYLYNKQYDLAESEATAIINNKTQYDTVRIDSVFIKNNKETIWALQPVRVGANTADGQLLVLPTTGPSYSISGLYLSDYVGNAFEAGDKRKINWTGSVIAAGIKYYYSNKYKVSVLNKPVSEYFIFFRLAEQYLIRAEARANLNRLSEGRSDLNIIRKRAGLNEYMIDNRDDLLAAILKERNVELFAEGHRWFDLKRTDNVDKVMSLVTPLKGGTWKPEWALYPVPNSERIVNDNLSQNPGYEN